MNNDGKLDVVSGDTWYEAPNWTPHHVRDVGQDGHVLTTASRTLADGRQRRRQHGLRDCSVTSARTSAGSRTRAPGKDWTYHEIDMPGTSEAAAVVDLTGDGKPDILPNYRQRGRLVRPREGAGRRRVWKKHDLGNAAAGHGVGSGDVNGDGRVDILTPKGWFEAPADPKAETWAWHPEWQLGRRGSRSSRRDVDGDGLADVVFGNGHNYGLFWLKQAKAADGAANLDEGHDRRHGRLGPHPALGRPRRRRQGRTSSSPASASMPTRSSRARPTARSSPSTRFDRDGKRWVKHVDLPGRARQERPRQGGRTATPSRISPPAPPAPASR